jgi:hypothetical protein
VTDRHKRAPVAFRPPEDDEKWLRDHAAATGQPVGAILTAALGAYRTLQSDELRAEVVRICVDNWAEPEINSHWPEDLAGALLKELLAPS